MLNNTSVHILPWRAKGGWVLKVKVEAYKHPAKEKGRVSLTCSRILIYIQIFDMPVVSHRVNRTE